MQAASTAVSLNSMRPQSPACGVFASVGVVSPARGVVAARRRKMRPVVFVPTMFSAPFTLKTTNEPLGLSTTCGSTVSVTPLAIVSVPVGR